jgi:LysM repeat protein
MKALRIVVLVSVIFVSFSVALVTPLKARPSLGQHRVLPGETLYCIGRGYGVAPWAIAQANNLAVLARLTVGQVLAIPAVAWSRVPPGPACAPQFEVSDLLPALTAALPTAVVAGSSFHIVQRGDSLWRIGNLYGVTVAALKAANQLQSDIIYVDQRLIIPGTVVVAATSTDVGPFALATSPFPGETVLAPITEPAPAPTDTQGAPPVTETVTVAPTLSPTPVSATETAQVPTASPIPVSATQTVQVPTASPTVTPIPASPTSSPTLAPAGDPLNCAVPNIAWSQAGQLLRGGQPDGEAFACLADAGVDVILDQRLPSEDSLNEPALAQQAGLEYINLGIGDDTAPSPAVLGAWIDTVNTRLAQGKIVLVHDAAGRGRMGVWDAVYVMLHGASAESAIEDRYLAKALPFTGAKIGCGDGGNGQVQALAMIGQILTGVTYYPTLDEYGTPWFGCPVPAYMADWDYTAVLP